MLWCWPVYYLVHSDFSGVSPCIIGCTPIALVLACVLPGALGLLWCWSVYWLAHTVGCELQMLDQEAIVETTNERTAIDSKLIITLLPSLKLADAKSERIHMGGQ